MRGIQELQILILLMTSAVLGFFMFFGMSGEFIENYSGATEIFSCYITANSLYMAGLDNAKKFLENYSSPFCTYYYKLAPFNIYIISVYNIENDKIEDFEGNSYSTGSCPEVIKYITEEIKDKCDDKYCLPPKGLVMANYPDELNTQEKVIALLALFLLPLAPETAIAGYLAYKGVDYIYDEVHKALGSDEYKWFYYVLPFYDKDDDKPKYLIVTKLSYTKNVNQYWALYITITFNESVKMLGGIPWES